MNVYKGISNFGTEKEGKVSFYQKWLFAKELRYIKETMILDGHAKSFIEKKIKEKLKKIENTPDNLNMDKTDGIAKLFLCYKRAYQVNIKRITKNMALMWFLPEEKLWNRNSTPIGEKVEKQGVV